MFTTLKNIGLLLLKRQARTGLDEKFKSQLLYHILDNAAG